jgi:hypothetical protein
MQELEKLFEEQEVIRKKINSLIHDDLLISRKINNIVHDLPMIYGRCIKQIALYHQSDQYNAYDITTINVGDVVEFFRHPKGRSSITVHPNCGEWFYIPYSEEYFEFIRENEILPTETIRSFNRD